MKLTGRPLSLMISVVSTCGFLLFGYDQGVMAGLISATDFNNQFPQTRDNSVWYVVHNPVANGVRNNCIFCYYLSS